MNLVAEQTDSEWIATANADIAVHPGCARDAARGGRRRSARRRARRRGCGCPTAARSTRSARFPRSPSRCCTRSARSASVADRGPLRLPGAMGHRAPPAGRRGRSARSSSCAATAWDEVGGFDERQWMYARGPRPRLAPAAGRLGHALRAARCRGARGRRLDVAAVRRRARAALAARHLRLHRATPQPGIRARRRPRQPVPCAQPLAAVLMRTRGRADAAERRAGYRAGCVCTSTRLTRARISSALHKLPPNASDRHDRLPRLQPPRRAADEPRSR